MENIIKTYGEHYPQRISIVCDSLPNKEPVFDGEHFENSIMRGIVLLRLPALYKGPEPATISVKQY